MLRIAGQRAGPIGLKFVVDSHGWPRMLLAKKIEFFSKNIFKKISWATPGPSASN